MEQEKYRVILHGCLVDGHQPDEVAQALGNLFSVPPRKFIRLFNGKRSPIKRILNRRKAESLQARIQAVGAECSIEQMSDAVAVKRSAESVAAAKAVIQALEPHRVKLIGGVFVAALLMGVIYWFSGTDQPVTQNPVSKMDVSQIQPPPMPDETEITRQQLGDLVRSVRLWMIQFGGSFDARKVNLLRLQRDMQLKPDAFQDAWGRPVSYQADADGFTLLSAGPDGQWSTADDLIQKSGFSF